MTSFRTLLKIVLPFIVIPVFHPVEAEDHVQILLNEAVPPQRNYLIPAESEPDKSQLRAIEHISWQVEREFRSLLGYRNIKHLADQDPFKWKSMWQTKIDSIQNPLVQNGLLKKLATSSTAHNHIFFNMVLHYILMEKNDGWNFKEAIPILKQNKNYPILRECLDLRKWHVNDTDSEFVRETFKRAIIYYDPKLQSNRLCRKLIEKKVVINGTEEAAVAFLMIDKIAKKRVKEAYLKKLIKQPLQPETKQNLMLQLYKCNWKSWVIKLNQTMGWPLPLNITHMENHGNRVSNVLQYIAGFFANNREHPKIDDGKLSEVNNMEHAENEGREHIGGVRKILGEVKGLFQSSNQYNRLY